MKIFFLPCDYDGCYYYRGYLPGIYSGNLVTGDFIGRQFDVEAIVAKSKAADIIVIQRPNEPKRAYIAKSLKEMGKKVIVDNDDTYDVERGVPMHLLDNDNQRDIARHMSKYINDTLAIAHGATVSTPLLAEEYKKINPNVAILKNCIDPLDEYECKANTTGKFRVGFIGSVSTNDDYVHIKEQIKELDERGDVTIVVFGIKFKDGSLLPSTGTDHAFWSSLKNVEWQPFVAQNLYYWTIAQLALDLVIIPRKEHYFNQCKSNLKFLEMSLLNIPVIAQGFTDGTSPYQGPDAEYMTVVTDNSEWYNKIIEIKDNHFTYKELARQAHDYVLENYNITTYWEEWVKQIIKLCS